MLSVVKRIVPQNKNFEIEIKVKYSFWFRCFYLPLITAILFLADYFNIDAALNRKRFFYWCGKGVKFKIKNKK